MAYSVRVLPAALKSLKRLPADVRRRIVERVSALAEDPRPAGSLKLRGADDLYRFRVRDYRVLYSIEDELLTVLVVRVGHRRDVYR